jgi:hypothetical protein
MQRTEEKMALLYPALPSPMPEGQVKEAFFNENYQKLGPTPACIWFQYGMVPDVQAERSLPSLLQTLRTPAYP